MHEQTAKLSDELDVCHRRIEKLQVDRRELINDFHIHRQQSTQYIDNLKLDFRTIYDIHTHELIREHKKASTQAARVNLLHRSQSLARRQHFKDTAEVYDLQKTVRHVKSQRRRYRQSLATELSGQQRIGRAFQAMIVVSKHTTETASTGEADHSRRMRHIKRSINGTLRTLTKCAADLDIEVPQSTNPQSLEDMLKSVKSLSVQYVQAVRGWQWLGEQQSEHTNELREQLVGAGDRITELEASGEQLKADLGESNDSTQRLHQQIQKLEETAEASTSLVSSLESTVQEQAIRIEEMGTYVAKLEEDQQGKQLEQERLQSDLDKAAAQLEKLGEDAAGLQKDLGNARRDESALQDDLTKLRRAIDEKNVEAVNLQQAIDLADASRQEKNAEMALMISDCDRAYSYLAAHHGTTDLSPLGSPPEPIATPIFDRSINFKTVPEEDFKILADTKAKMYRTFSMQVKVIDAMALQGEKMKMHMLQRREHERAIPLQEKAVLQEMLSRQTTRAEHYKKRAYVNQLKYLAMAGICDAQKTMSKPPDVPHTRISEGLKKIQALRQRAEQMLMRKDDDSGYSDGEATQCGKRKSVMEGVDGEGTEKRTRVV